MLFCTLLGMLNKNIPTPEKMSTELFSKEETDKAVYRHCNEISILFLCFKQIHIPV